MKKFRFRLEQLLRVKDHLEKERQREHAKATREVIRQKEHLARLHGDREVTADIQRQLTVKPFTASELLICSRYFLKLRRDSLTGSELLRGLQRDAEERRLALVEASRVRKIYEKLKENRKAAYLTELARSEQKDTDETAVAGYRHPQRS